MDLGWICLGWGVIVVVALVFVNGVGGFGVDLFGLGGVIVDVVLVYVNGGGWICG